MKMVFFFYCDLRYMVELAVKLLESVLQYYSQTCCGYWMAEQSMVPIPDRMVGKEAVFSLINHTPAIKRNFNVYDMS